MGHDDSAKHNTNKPLDKLPAVGKGVFVKHDGCQRMGYRDAEGVWRDYYSGEILRGEVTYQGD